MQRIIIVGFVGILVGTMVGYQLRGEPESFQPTNRDAQYQALGSKIDRLESLLLQQTSTVAAYAPPSLMSGLTAQPAQPGASPHPDSSTSAPFERSNPAPEEESQVAQMLADIQAKSYGPSATFHETMTSGVFLRLSPSAQQRVIEEVINRVNRGEIPVGFIFPVARHPKGQ